MKKYIIIGITLLVLIISLITFFLLKKKRLSTHQLKERMKDTTSIYVCNSTDTLDKVCDEDNLIKIITDKNDIDDFIIIVQRAEEMENVTFVKDSYTLYLVNDNNKIILVMDYNPHLIIRLPQKEIFLSSQEVSTIEEILKIEN